MSTLVIFLTRDASPLGLEEHVFGRGFELMAGVLGICLILTFIWWGHRQGRFDLFELPVWISLNIYVQVVLNVWLLQRDQFPTVPWLRANFEAHMVRAVLLFGVGLTALWLSYTWTFPLFHRKSKAKLFGDRRVRLRSAFAVWLIGWILFNLLIFTSSIGYLPGGSNVFGAWLNYIHLFNLIQLTAATALVIHYFRYPTRFGKLWVIFMFASNVASSLVLGTKGFVLTLIWLVICIYYATAKFPVRWVVIGIVVVVIFVPAVNIYRQNLHDIDPGTGVNVAGRLRALSSAFQNLSAMSLQSLFENAEETFEKRQGSMLEITASTMVLHPSTIPFLGLNIVEYFFDQLIPRIFWPAKPVERDPLFMITSIYYGASEEYTFSSIGLFADSYRIGGWPFLIIWFALCGIFSAWLYRAGPGGGYVPNVVFYIVLLQGILYYDTEVSTVLLRLVHFVPFIFLLIKYVLFEPQKNY